MNTKLYRERFKFANDWAKRNGTVAQISKIRVSVPLLDGEGQLAFDIKDENVKKYVGDVGLKRNDVFIPIKQTVGIIFDTYEAGTPTLGRTGRAPLHTYPLMANAATRGFITSDIEGLYSGKLTQRIDQRQINESFPMESFRVVPETQPVQITDGDGNLISAGIIAQSNLETDTKDVIPNLLLSGKFDVNIEVEFNGTGASYAIAEAATPTVPSTTHKAYAVFYAEGILIKNGADDDKYASLTQALGLV
jgi:hypothetical protein